MEQVSTDTGEGHRPSTGFADEGQFFGTLNVAFGEVTDEDEADDDLIEMQDSTFETALGVGSESDLISWVNRLRTTDDDVLPEGIEILGVWIVLLPTERGRIPWEKGQELGGKVLLLEGSIPEGALDDDDDLPVKRVPASTAH